MVSIPLAIDTPLRRPDQLFAELLPHLQSAAWFDAAAQQWVSFSPQSLTWAATGPPDFAGLCLRVDRDVDWRVVGSAASPGEAVLPALSAGWQCFGLGRLQHDPQALSWAPGPLSLRQIAAQFPGSGLDIEHDAVYPASATLSLSAQRLAADDLLHPGQAYWLQRPAPAPTPTPTRSAPLPLSVTAPSPVGSTPEQRAQRTTELTTAQSSKQTLYPTQLGTVTIGGFTITDMRCRQDGNGNRVSGIGILRELPTDVAALLAINDDYPFAVEVDFRENKPVSAFACGQQLDAGSSLSGSSYLAPTHTTDGRITAWEQTVTAANVLYLLIAVTDHYPDGYVHLEIEKDAGFGDGKVPAYFQVFTPSGELKDSRSGRFKEDSPFFWGRFGAVFGQPEDAGAESDLVMSKVWTLDPVAGTGTEALIAKEGRRQALQAAGEWLLNWPESAEDVFEPLPAGSTGTALKYGYDPRKWLHFLPDAPVAGARRLTMTGSGVERVQLLRRWAFGLRTDDLAIPVKDGKVRVDEYGSLWFDDGRSGRQTRVSFRHGRIEFTDARWDHVGFWVLYKRGHLVPTIGLTAQLEPGQYGGDVELKEARLDATFGLDVILHLQGIVQNAKAESTYGIFELLSGLVDAALFGMFPDDREPPSPAELKPFVGSSVTLGVDIDLRLVSTASDVEIAFPMGYQYRMQIPSETAIDTYHTLRGEFELQHESVAANLFFESVLQFSILTRNSEFHGHHTLYTGWSASGTIPADADSPWAGKTLTLADRAKIRSDMRYEGDFMLYYTSEPMFSFTATDSQVAPVGGDGWNFLVDEARFEGQPFRFSIEGRNFFADTFVALAKHAQTRYRPRPGTRTPNCLFVKRAMVNSRLESPADLHDLFSGATISADLQYRDGSPWYALKSGVDSFTFVAQLGFRGGTDDLQVELNEAYVSVRPGPPCVFSAAAKVQLTWASRPMTVEGVISREADGTWMFTGTISDVTAISGDLEFGRLDSVMISFPLYVKSAGPAQPKGVEWLKRVQLMVSGRLDSQEIRDKLGLPEGIELTGMVAFPDGNLKSATLTAMCGAIPLQGLNNLRTEFADVPGFEFEKLSNVAIQVSPGKKSYMFNLDVDMVAKAFVPDPDKTPREKWPRLTLGATVNSQLDAAGNRTTGIDARGSNLFSIAFNEDVRGANEEDGGVILKQIRFAIEKGAGRTNIWELDGGIELVLPNRAVALARDALCEVPQHIDLTGKYYRTGGRPGWMFAARFGKKVELGGLDLMLNDFVVTKQSPWSFGFNAAVGYGGKTFEGTLGVLSDGFKFLLPADLLLDWKLPGDVGLGVKNFGMAVGKELGLSGDVDLHLPADNPMRAVVGENLKGRLQAGVTGFEAILNVDAAKTVDMGPLGQAMFTFDSLKVNSMGAFSGKGRVGLAGRTVGFEIGMQGPSVFVTVDLGEEGISADLACFFEMEIRKKLGYRCIAGAQMVQIDDARIAAGVLPLSGFEYRTERLFYVLPVTVPPVGFAFFDNLEGKTYMCGFAINAGLAFPAPTGQDLITLLTFLADAFGGGDVNWTKLGQLHAPALGIHDVYLDFPRVPGYMYKDGQWQQTDHLFRTIFGLDRWTFIDRIQVDPGTVVRLATADSIYDVADILIPSSARQKQGTLDLRGFRANAGYTIRGDRTLFEDHTVARLPEMDRFVQRLRYVNANTGADPADLVLRPELEAWSGHDLEMSHRCGRAESLRPVRDQVTYLVKKFLVGNEFVNRNLTAEGLRTEAKRLYGTAAIDDLYTRLARSGPVTVDALKQALPTDDRCLTDVVAKYQLQDRLTDAFGNDLYLTFFGRQADVGGRRYWLRVAFGPCTWIAAKGQTGHMLYGPYRPLAKGKYQAVFGLRIENRASANVVTIDVGAGHGSQTFATQTLKGTDFAVTAKTENRILDFTVPADVSDIEFRVHTTGAVGVTLDAVRLLAGGSVVTRDVPIAAGLGGGKATVRWEGVDIQPELLQLEALANDLALPAGKTWDQHLELILAQLRRRDASPEVRDRRLLFAWSPEWRVEVELNRGSRGDINAVRWLDGGLRVRCGRATVYRDANFAGSALELTDDRSFSAEPMPDNSVSSVKIEGNGQVALYADANGSGTQLLATRSLADLSTQSFNDMASSALVYLPIKPYEIKDWRVVAASSSGVTVTLDAGAWEARFPAGERLVWMPDTSRLAKACLEVRSAVNSLRPYSEFFDDPDRWLRTLWDTVLLPLKADASIQGDATLVFSKYPSGTRTASTRPDWTIGLRPFTDRWGRSITGLKLDRDQGALSVRRGTVTLFQHSSYQGNSLVVTDDLPSLAGTAVGDEAVSSIRCEDSGSVALYDLDQYRAWDEIGRSELSRVEKRAANAQAGSGTWRFTQCADNTLMFRYRNPYSTASGRYRYVVTCTYEPIRVVPPAETPMLRLDFVPAAGSRQSFTLRKGQMNYGDAVTFGLDVEANQAAMPATIELYQLYGNSTMVVNEPAYIQYMAKPANPVETVSQSDDSLVNNPIGNDKVSSVKVFSPLPLWDVGRFDVSRTLPGGGVLHLTRQADAARIGVELNDTRNRVDCRFDPRGFALTSATTADGHIYPVSGYTLYAGGGSFVLDRLADAARHVRVMCRRTQMPEGPLVAQVGSAMNTEYQGVRIEPAGPGDPVSKFDLPADNGAALRFLLPPAAGGFNRALVAGSNPEDWWPTYARADGLTSGIRRPVGTEPGGLFINADVQAGYQDYVRLALQVSGSIETNGSFELRGNGDVVLGGYTLSEAEIVLGSEQGLFIRGRMDLFGVAQALVEGYVRPDGQFAFTGAASLMVQGTGIRGALTVGNEGLFINGGFYLFDRSLHSGSFGITRGGRVSYSESLGIGIAGIDYSVWVQFVEALGVGVEGNAWVDLEVPIRIWGPTDWDCCCWDAICWPTDWGWMTLATIRAHYDAHFGPWEVTTQEIQVPFAVGTFRYNLATRQSSVDWL